MTPLVVKTNKKDARVANVCISFCAGGRQTVRQLCVIKSRKQEKTDVKLLLFSQLLLALMLQDVGVWQRSSAQRMLINTKPHEFWSEHSHSWFMVTHQICIWIRTTYESESDLILRRSDFCVHSALKRSDMWHIEATKISLGLST